MTDHGMHGKHRYLRQISGILIVLILTGSFVFAAFASAMPEEAPGKSESLEESEAEVQEESKESELSEESESSAEWKRKEESEPCMETNLQEEPESQPETKTQEESESQTEVEIPEESSSQEEAEASEESSSQEEAEGPEESSSQEEAKGSEESSSQEEAKGSEEPSSQEEAEASEEPSSQEETEVPEELSSSGEFDVMEVSAENMESTEEIDDEISETEESFKKANVQALALPRDGTVSVADVVIQDTVNNGSNGEKPAVRDGRLTLKILDPDGYEISAEDLVNAGYRIVWTRQQEGTGSTETVTRKKITQDSCNMDEYGAWVNAALDKGARCTYTVAIMDPEGEKAGSASAAVQWYDSLQNGSFEMPACADGSSFQPFVGNATQGIVWKTTASDGEIEIVSASAVKHDSNGRINQYMSDLWHGISSAADGEQYAELNANVQSSLYQDVMTIPGSKMYWQVAHAARLRNGGNRFSGTDEMYVVVMNADQASELAKDQKKLVDIAKKLAQKDVAVMARYPGASSTLCMSNSSSWKYNSGTYTVPSGQYVTRYFFVAASSAANNTGYVAGENANPIPSGKAAYNSMGNHIDKVWFSTEVPPPSPGSGTLIITKKIYGLDLETIRANLSGKPFIETDKNRTISFRAEDWTEGLDENGNSCITASAVIEGITIPAGGSASWQIQENQSEAQVPMHQLTCENPDQTVTVTDRKTSQAVIVNRYQRNMVNVTVRKRVEGELGDRKKAFSFQCTWTGEDGTAQKKEFSLKHEESITFTVPEGTALALRELNADGYWIDAACSIGNAPEINENIIRFAGEAEQILTVTNIRNWIPDTGVALDSLPYLLILLVAAIGTVALMILRHKDKENE